VGHRTRQIGVQDRHRQRVLWLIYGPNSITTTLLHIDANCRATQRSRSRSLRMHLHLRHKRTLHRCSGAALQGLAVCTILRRRRFVRRGKRWMPSSSSWMKVNTSALTSSRRKRMARTWRRRQDRFLEYTALERRSALSQHYRGR